MSPFGLAIPAGGILAVVGSIQTWSTGKVGRKKVGYNGFQHGHNGVLFVLLGIVLIAVGLLIVRLGRQLIPAMIASVIGVAVSIVAVFDLADIANHSDGFVAGATVGPGLPIVLLGGVIAVVAVVATLLEKSARAIRRGDRRSSRQSTRSRPTDGSARSAWRSPWSVLEGDL